MSASLAEACSQTRLPPLARLGFDDGWLMLRPTFLNLRRPVLLVDKLLLGSIVGLGLEPFGSRDPRARLPDCRVEVAVVGNSVSLWSESRSCMASHWFDRVDPRVDFARFAEMVLLVGSTYAIESSWSALWTCSIGQAQVARFWS